MSRAARRYQKWERGARQAAWQDARSLTLDLYHGRAGPLGPRTSRTWHPKHRGGETGSSDPGMAVHSPALDRASPYIPSELPLAAGFEEQTLASTSSTYVASWGPFQPTRTLSAWLLLAGSGSSVTEITLATKVSSVPPTRSW